MSREMTKRDAAAALGMNLDALTKRIQRAKGEPFTVPVAGIEVELLAVKQEGAWLVLLPDVLPGELPTPPAPFPETGGEDVQDIPPVVQDVQAEELGSAGASPSPPLLTEDERAELARLRLENVELKVEVHVLTRVNEQHQGLIAKMHADALALQERLQWTKALPAPVEKPPRRFLGFLWRIPD